MIKSIEIENFMSIKSAKFDLPQLTLLYGNNSSGKSNLIKNILLVRQADIYGGKCFNGKYLQIDAENTIYKWANKPWKAKYDFGNNICVSYELTHKDGKHELINYLDSDIAINQFDFIQYLQTEPLFNHRFQYQFLTILDDAPRSCCIDILDNLRKKRPVIFEDMSAFKGYLRNEDEFYDIMRSSEIILKRMHFFASLLYAKPGDLIILHHPEVFLHPKYQALFGRMIAVLAQKGVQIIVESHSDHILNATFVACKQKVIDHKQVMIYNFELVNDGKKFWSEVTASGIRENGLMATNIPCFMDQIDKDMTTLLGF